MYGLVEMIGSGVMLVCDMVCCLIFVGVLCCLGNWWIEVFWLNVLEFEELSFVCCFIEFKLVEMVVENNVKLLVKLLKDIDLELD